MRRIAMGFAVATMTGAVLLSLALPATAGVEAARPKLSWQFQVADVDQNGPAVAMYQVSGLPKGGKVVLERAFGTANVFKSVAESRTASGAISATAPAMGQYTYRMVVKSKSGKRLIWGDQSLRAYADVPLSTMMSTSTNTHQIGATLFRYTIDGGYEYAWDPSSCRSLTITAGSTSPTSSPPATVSIVQERADMVTLSVPSGQIVSTSTPIGGGAVKLSSRRSSYNGSIYVDGVGSCFTTTGQIATS